MDFMKFARSSTGVGLGLALGRSVPPWIGYPGGRFIADWMAGRKGSSLVRTIRANQWVIRGEKSTSEELDEAAKEVLRHQARCFYDLYHTLTNPEKMGKLLAKSPATENLVEISRSGDSGTFVVAPHLSNFDLALLALAYRGLQGQVLTYGEPTGGYKIQNDIRAQTDLVITPVSDEAHQKAIQTMQNGGIVITAVDRPIKRKAHTLTFFNRASPMPAGHIRMALEAKVPVRVVAACTHSDTQYDIHLSEPIPMEPHTNPATEIRQNGEAVLSVIEGYIRQAPGEWLMYYPPWPEALEEMP
jgi:KDO2-lipid IV(A) lauroyltransferase